MLPRIVPFSWRLHSRDVLEFQRETYEVNFPGFVINRDFLRGYADQLRRAANSASEGLFVLEADRRAQGFVWVALISTMVEPCIGYIKNVYVVPALRGQGYARRLLQVAEEWCLRKGVRRISLDASCCNTRAVDIYCKAGYQIVRLRMEKDLDPATLYERPSSATEVVGMGSALPDTSS